MSKVVLVVEDEEVLCDMIVETIASYDIVVEKAYSAEAGWEILQSKKIDLMVSDIRLPGMDGIELTKKAKREENLCSAVFIMSGFSDYSEEEIVAAGAVGLYKKPGDIERLVDDVVNFIQESSESTVESA